MWKTSSFFLTQRSSKRRKERKENVDGQNVYPTAYACTLLNENYDLPSALM